MSALWRFWRTAATVWCFAFFALGGMVLGILGLPLVWIMCRGRESRQAAGRRIVQWGFRLFVWVMRTVGVLRVDYVGFDVLPTSGNLILANHPTLIDFVVLAAAIPRSDCIIKSSLLGNWYNRWPILLAGYIRNDDGESALHHCRRSLDCGNNVIIFPEGTRSSPGMPVTFRKGAAHVAVRINQDVTPIIISCDDSNLHKDGPWYLAPPHQVRIALAVQGIIPVAPFVSAHPGRPARAARELNDHLQCFFNKGLVHERSRA